LRLKRKRQKATKNYEPEVNRVTIQPEANMTDPVLSTIPLGLHWPTLDPFLFCAHHRDAFPAGNDNQGVQASELQGRNIGSDFVLKDGWRMYHGREVPGFPQHPHRGFETVTIAREGFIDHADSLGAQSRFGHGDVQWMTAGKGVVHAEMFPLVNANQGNPTELFQIWLNLPAASKMVDPYFTMIWNEDVPRVQHSDEAGRQTEVAVIAGTLSGATGATTPPDSWAAEPSHGVNIWTIVMQPGATWTLPASGADVSRVLYAYKTAGLTVANHTLDGPLGVQLKSDQAVTLTNKTGPTELLLLEGRPQGEPVAQHGPFVMNTRTELQQAFDDYRRTGFGGWPWDRDDPVLTRSTTRFARHADGRIEKPGEPT